MLPSPFVASFAASLVWLGLAGALVGGLPAQTPAPVPTPAPAPAPAAVAPAAEVVLGTGKHRYRWVTGWGQRADGKDLGNTHGCLVVDKQGRLYANTDTEQAVVVFDADGRWLGAWGKEFRGGLHGMCLREEGGEERLYLAHTGRHEVVQTTLDGKVLWTIGWPEAAGIYANEGEYKPTAVAVAPDGRIFVADGYGKSWVHLYDRDRNYLKSIGGAGNADGKFQTPHGLWLDTRGKEPLLLVCDRENHRLQWFSLAGEFVRKCDQGLRRPCNVWPLADGGLAVADLHGRVTILDAKDQVVCHLGDAADEKQKATNGVGKELWRDGVFFAPHAVCADRAGNLYVMDWNRHGRISKLLRL